MENSGVKIFPLFTKEVRLYVVYGPMQHYQTLNSLYSALFEFKVLCSMYNYRELLPSQNCFRCILILRNSLFDYT